ncbi:MAG: hypothetical protein ABIK93_02770 [candidate division WOR-3 bacterium]
MNNNLQPVIKILKWSSGRVLVFFPYNLNFIEKIKIIKGYNWHPEEKYWSFSNPNGILAKILKVFEGERVYLELNQGGSE